MTDRYAVFGNAATTDRDFIYAQRVRLAGSDGLLAFSHKPLGRHGRQRISGRGRPTVIP
ncbi:hypothetical protein OEW28_09350 [Defluviimonas sp. WL0002]|uniref:Uncharacterized protein n=1 Tax=Albidovulum marisflavi TaxID=2984159 RepID=A0ABT2ZCM1_9RHOB|nr:hypothetical protein [Defluviimonas sp. WL0002]MCV2868832.1 hypothetical protein [Defluviimonas sp. WL0002]